MDIQIRSLDRAIGMGYAPVVDEPSDFPLVEVTPVYDREGEKIPGYQRIYRDDTGDTLAIHTAGYEMRPYADSFHRLEEAIGESSLDQRNLMVKTEYSHNGGRCFRSYLFPHVGIEVKNADDQLSLQILAFDSYDGSYSTSIAAGGFRHICLNGSFFGRTIQQLKVRHVPGSSVRFENGLARVMEAAETFTEMQPRLKLWPTITLDVQEFNHLVRDALPQATDRVADYLTARYATEAEESTLYGAWNICTAWASRGEGTAQSRIDRDRRVASMIESRAWRRLEGTL